MFKIKDLGEPKKILRIRITRNRQDSILKLDQEHYANTNIVKMHIAKEKLSPTHLLIDNYKSLCKLKPKDNRCSKEDY